jgi:hypothetical protein
MASHFTTANGAGAKPEDVTSGNGAESTVPAATPATPEPSGSTTAKPD